MVSCAILSEASRCASAVVSVSILSCCTSDVMGMTVPRHMRARHGSIPVNRFGNWPEPCLRGALWLPGASGHSPVDALEQHRQLCRRERHGATISLRPDEAPLLQALGKQAQALAVPPQQFDDVAPAATKHEHMAGERILGQRSSAPARPGRRSLCACRSALLPATPACPRASRSSKRRQDLHDAAQLSRIESVGQAHGGRAQRQFDWGTPRALPGINARFDRRNRSSALNRHRQHRCQRADSRQLLTRQPFANRRWH